MTAADMSELDVASFAASRLQYNTSTGVFIWRPKINDEKGWNARYAGRVAGVVNPSGYRSICVSIDKVARRVWAHRLAWFVVHGRLPVTEIDHINQEKDDNRIQNLRETTRSENLRNRPLQRNNTSGINGVYWDRQKRKWRAQARVNRTLYRLGFYSSIEDAAAVTKAFRAANGFTALHGSARRQQKESTK